MLMCASCIKLVFCDLILIFMSEFFFANPPDLPVKEITCILFFFAYSIALTIFLVCFFVLLPPLVVKQINVSPEFE